MPRSAPSQACGDPLKISVIVPVHDVEKYLSKCLDSLVGQTLSPSEYEIICVDDGSADRSPEILDRYARAHPNIRAIHKAYEGVSAARNRGLDLAAGEYVLFVDSDDWLTRPDAMELLYGRAAELRLDELYFDSVKAFESEDLRGTRSAEAPRSRGDYPPDLVLSGQDMFIRQWDCRDYTPYLWRRLYRRAFLQENGLRFVYGCVYQDLAFTLECLALERRVAVWPICFYSYLMRENAISTARHRDPRPGIHSKLILSRELYAFERARLADAKPKFLELYRKRIRQWLDINVDEYASLTRQQRREFWRQYPLPLRLTQQRRMFADFCSLDWRKKKRWLRRHLPAALVRRIRELRGARRA